MKITMPQPDLLALLSAVSRGVSGRSTQPVQNSILLSAADGNLRIAATDLEYIGVEAFAEVATEEPGDLCAPNLLTAIVGKLADGEVCLESSSPHELLVSGGAARIKLRCLPSEDYQFLPEPQDAAEFTVPAGALREALARTVFSCGQDETRPTLTGALLSVEVEASRLVLVSTDTYRLTETVLPLAAAPGVSRKVIAYARFLNEVQRALGDTTEPVTVRLSDRLAQVATGKLRLTSRLIEGEFPHYEKILPVDFERELLVEVAPLREATQRALLVAKETPFRITLHMEDGSLRITSCGDTGDTTDEALFADLTGETLEWGVNGKMLLQALEAAQAERVRLRFNDTLNPALLDTGDGWRHVVMPLQPV